MEQNGDIYPCDHFVYPKSKLGNINDKSLKEMMQSSEQIKFGLDKRSMLPSKCLRCKWEHLCHGECPKHRFNRTENGDTGLNALCSGYYMFYERTAPYMHKMRDLLEAQTSPALVMPWARMMK